VRTEEFAEVRVESYEPPMIERVVTAEELAREIHYAGNEISVTDDPEN
jgi:hypothetical protein